MRKELDENGQQVAYFNATLVSVSNKVLENKNTKEYRVATIRFINELGVPKQVTATIYENNFKYGMEIGGNYACKAFATEQGVFTQMSHLSSAERAPFEDFGFVINEEGSPVVAGINVPKGETDPLEEKVRKELESSNNF